MARTSAGSTLRGFGLGRLFTKAVALSIPLRASNNGGYDDCLTLVPHALCRKGGCHSQGKARMPGRRHQGAPRRWACRPPIELAMVG